MIGTRFSVTTTLSQNNDCETIRESQQKRRGELLNKLKENYRIRKHITIKGVDNNTTTTGLSINSLRAAGLEYNAENGTVYCKQCNLVVPIGQVNGDVFDIHKTLSKKCEFMGSMTCEPHPEIHKSLQVLKDLSKNLSDNTRQDSNKTNTTSSIFNELKVIRSIRARSFSDWPVRHCQTANSMIEAGFFCCNVGDRVMCIYCLLICQNWVSTIKSPYEFHKEKSSNCPFILASEQWCAPSIVVLNDIFRDRTIFFNNTTLDHEYPTAFVPSNACHPNFALVPQRTRTFGNWPATDAPKVDDLVEAGFFYTGNKNIVTCFYCSGSLQNWGPNDNPKTEHARWFPYCGYAKQLCGEDLYRRIQESKFYTEEEQRLTAGNKVQQPKRNENEAMDDSVLSRCVAARLDLEVSQRELHRKVRVSILKRCWEDQLRLKRSDYVDLIDLIMSRLILEKQVQRIAGNKNNIVVMKEICSMSLTSVSEPTIELVASEFNEERKRQQEELFICTVCQAVKRALVFLPCGHCTTCVPCGHSFRTCSVCRAEISGYFRVYV